MYSHPSVINKGEFEGDIYFEIEYVSRLVDRITGKTFSPDIPGSIVDSKGQTPIDIRMACKMLVES